MGLIQAVYDQGVLARKTSQSSSLGEINSYLQVPMPVITDETKSGREIQVWLTVENSQADTLLVQGVAKLDMVEYPRTDKEQYLYREPISPAANWRFSPVYKLGKGITDGKKALIGIGSEKARLEMLEWLLGTRENLSSDIAKEIKDNRFYKIKNAMLDALEEENVFALGTVNTIMAYLLNNIDKLIEYWMDKKRSYIIVFGVTENGRFLYPGDISAFQKYFKKKLYTHILGESSDNSKKDNTHGYSCAVCGERVGAVITIDKLFAFSTFDKTNFLPGSRDIPGAKEKVYPLCRHCYSICSEGKERIKDYFRDSQTVWGLNIDIVPELIFGTDKLKRVSDETDLFLHEGIIREQNRFNSLAEKGKGLVYHFFFWEQNQRQERIHLLVEDVPPSRLKKILEIWQETNSILYLDKKEEVTLDRLFKLLPGVLLGLAGKRDEDKKAMRDYCIKLMGKLLGGEAIDIRWLKNLMVSRFSGLFADPEWVRKFGSFHLKNMLVLVDFFERMRR